ncbi:MAG: hypothetical protein HOQ05_06625 [Corynebacteriales bacterium]|nr:hypothetical protein [Mycobacteriales bacterium]
MKPTLNTKPVGPLSPTIYWRRRAIVVALGVFLLVAVLTAVAFAGGDSKENDKEATVQKAGQTVPKIQDGSKEHPFYPVPGPSPDASNSEPAPEAQQPPSQESAAPVVTPTGPTICADGDLKIEVVPAHTNYPVGSRLKIKLVITNTSAGECVRDIGAGAQEVWANGGNDRVWSTDHCSADRSTQESPIAAGESLSYWVVWDGLTSAEGCTGAGTKVSPGDYQLQGRLGSATSEPVTVSLK